MFGAARKKKPRPVRKAADSSDDDDGNEKETSAKLIEQAKRNKQKKRKKKPPPKTLSLSFDPGDGEDAEEDDTPLHSKSSGQKKKKQKKKSKSKKNSGLGYGGASQMSESDASDEDGIDVAQQQSSSYGAEALRQLHSEQKRTLTEKKVNGNDVSPNEKPREGESEKKRGSVEADYISLSGNNSSTVLTGEEALALADQDDDENDVNEFDHGLSERAPPTGERSERIGGRRTRRGSSGGATAVGGHHGKEGRRSTVRFSRPIVSWTKKASPRA